MLSVPWAIVITAEEASVWRLLQLYPVCKQIEHVLGGTEMLMAAATYSATAVVVSRLPYIRPNLYTGAAND